MLRLKDADVYHSSMKQSKGLFKAVLVLGDVPNALENESKDRYIYINY